MNRRDFLKISVLTGLNLAGLTAANVEYAPEDQKIFRAKIERALQENWAALPLNTLVIKVAESFIGVPYVAGTLDRRTEERLVVNLRELDCFTYLENVLAIARCVKLGKTTFTDFCAQLECIRYRGGRLNGYASRLHYFTEWLSDNQQKNILRVISGPTCEKKTLNILSRNLKNPAKIQAIRQIEEQLSQRQFCYFPNQVLAKPEVQSIFREGDIIGFVSNVKGLDINHVAFLHRSPQNGWTYIHASSVNNAVEIYAKDLVEYAFRIKRNTGIVLGRVV